MTIDTRCPNCNKAYKLPDTLVTMKVRCKHCTKVFVVEELEEPVTAITATKRQGFKPQPPIKNEEEPLKKEAVAAEEKNQENEETRLRKKLKSKNRPHSAGAGGLVFLLIGGVVVFFLLVLVVAGGVGLYFTFGRSGDPRANSADKSGGAPRDKSAGDPRAGDTKTVTVANYDKLQEGMTEADVKGILGEPSLLIDSATAICLMDSTLTNRAFYGKRLPADFQWPFRMRWTQGISQIDIGFHNNQVVFIDARFDAKVVHKGKNVILEDLIRSGLPRLKNAKISRVTAGRIEKGMAEETVIALVGGQPERYGRGPWGDEMLLWVDDRGGIEIMFLEKKCCGHMLFGLQ